MPSYPEQELRELYAAMKEINDTVEAEGRDKLTELETRQFDLYEKKFKATERQIAREGRKSAGTPTPFNGMTSAVTSPTSSLAREHRFVDWHQQHGGGSAWNPEEVRDFSLGRFVQGMATGQWDDAELERRALSEGTTTAGGFLTPEALSSSIIDRVRNKARVLQAGATTIPVTSDSFSIPRLNGGVTPAWRAENAPVTGSDPTFQRVTFAVKTLAAKVTMSYELLEDMTGAGRDIVERELLAAMALEVDRVALRGSGSGAEPTGLKNQSGVTLQSLGTNGAAPTVASLMTPVTTLLGANIEPNGIIWSPRTNQEYASIVDTTGQPIRFPDVLDTIPKFITNQIPNNVTTGSSNVTSEIYIGAWENLLIGFRPSVQIGVGSVSGSIDTRLAVNDYVGMDNLQRVIYAWLRVDIQLAHPEAFVVQTGVL